jgi:hypothetical protein
MVKCSETALALPFGVPNGQAIGSLLPDGLVGHGGRVGLIVASLLSSE